MKKLQSMEMGYRPAEIETYYKKSSNCLQKIIERNYDEPKSLTMNNNNAAETPNKLKFHLGSFTAKMAI